MVIGIFPLSTSKKTQESIITRLQMLASLVLISDFQTMPLSKPYPQTLTKESCGSMKNWMGRLSVEKSLIRMGMSPP